jgi:CheY-like chemotaxis protein
VKGARKIHVLVIEDSPSDANLLLEAFAEHQVGCEIQVVADGEEALAFLRREGPRRGAPPIDLIFLDLNLPRKDGREVLADIKADPQLRAIPVVVMTTSAAERDIARCYDLQASSYVVKPLGIDEFLAHMEILCAYWFRVATLPVAVPPRGERS